MTAQQPWLAKYPQGIPPTINEQEYPSLIALIDEFLRKYATQEAFECMGKTLTFDEVHVASEHFAAYLHSVGLRPGDRLALMLPNLLQYPIALYGALRAGVVVVNTNPLYTPREMRHQFIDSGATAILICENFAANLQSILPETAIKTIIVTSVGELLGAVKGTIVNFVVRNVKKMVPRYRLPNSVTFSEALRKGAKATLQPFQARPEDVILLQYTGGTTGVSKGAMLTNGNLVANMLQTRAWMRPYLRDGKELALCPLPLYHIFAFTINCLVLPSIGTKNLLITNARDLPALIKVLQKNKISVMVGINTLYNALMNHSAFKSIDFSELKVSVGGGMAVQRAVAERWQQNTGCPLAEGYGMTETSPVVTVNPLDGSGQLGTIGLPMPSTWVRIADEAGNEVPAGQVGELQVKGPQVMKGYYNRPDETAKVMKDGWLCTGDMAVMSADGYFKIVDRKKDMILVSGFNVYPNEIEDVLAMHPKVLESAAVGVPDEKSSEAVKVFVVKKEDSLTAEEVIAHCKANLTGYKVPKHVEFRSELPKTNVGKILRRMLKD